MDEYRTRLMDALAKQHRVVFDYDTWRMKEEFCEYLDCPACHGADRVTAFSKDWFVFSRCCNCGMVYLNPRLNDAATYQFYNSEWNAIYNERKFEAGALSDGVDDRRNDANLQSITRIKGPGKLLEIGIGNGYFLKRAQQLGYDVHGVELNQRNCQLAAEKLGDPGRIFNTDLFSVGFAEESFDVIYMKDVFEHVPNPRAMLAEFNRIAKKGCLLCIEVPNIEGWIFKMVGARHECIFAFEHLNYWSPRSLQLALEAEGFAVSEVQHESDDFTPTQILSYWIDNVFTSLEPVCCSGVKRFALRCARKLLSLPPLSFLDRSFARLPDLFGGGSQIKVFAVKQ